MTLRRSILIAAVLGTAGALPSGALAQAAWPAKPVRILVGSPPGGPSDITARLFGEALTRRSGQPVLVENRTGAGNNLAAGIVAKSEPDGHTLVLSPDTVLTVNPLVYRNAGFDARTELANVSIIATFSQMLVCNPKVGVSSVADLIAKARAGRLTYASGGPGVPGHLAAELFLQNAGVRMDHVPYRGPAPATQAVLAGEADCGFLATPTVVPHVKAGKLSALAVSSAAPSPLAPDVPTLAQAMKMRALDATFRLVLQAAKATPQAVVAEIEKAAADIMKEPAVRQRLSATDLVALGTPSAASEQVLRAEMLKWEPVVKRLELKAD